MNSKLSMNSSRKQNALSRRSCLLIGLGILTMVFYGRYVAGRWYKLDSLRESPTISFNERIDLNTRKELDEKLWSIYPPDLRTISPSLIASAAFVVFGIDNLRNEVIISIQNGQICVNIVQVEGRRWFKARIVLLQSNDGFHLVDSEIAHGPR